MDEALKKLHIGGHKDEAPPPAPAPVAAPPKEEERSFLDKLTGHHDKPTPPPAPVAKPDPPKDESFLGKVTSHLHHSDPEPTPAPPPPPPPVEKHESLLDKVSGVFGHKEEPAPPPPPPSTEKPSLFERVSDHVTGDKKKREEEERKRKEEEEKDLFHKIKDHVHPHEEPPKAHGFHDKLNEHLGGGHKSEQEEGKLGKTIDFVQEHILGEGQQKNETWYEQKKDDRIESAIRHGLHLGDKDKDKKDKH
ncbi:hypothetical protein DL96DRAFT_1587955 [Flagelloscypha sp. PMI_526]|nr:hypothetical protein DL96DRAFT_1587955 [Flagelloscypha sp. PMI_526]